MEFLIAWLIIGGLTAMNAKRKGRTPMGWFLIGFLFGPLGLIISFLVRDNTEALEAASIEAGESKRCPHCAETVKAEAVKCRHCGEAV